MKHLLLSALLLSGLAGCEKHTIQGPNGCQVTGPTVQGNTTSYTVRGYRQGNDSIQKFLDDIAYSSVSADNEPGTYDVYFIDSTGHSVSSKHAHILEDELDRRHKISFIP